MCVCVCVCVCVGGWVGKGVKVCPWNGCENLSTICCMHVCDTGQCSRVCTGE